MSNKTSDKNVGSVEDDVKILNNFCEFEDAVVLTDYALTLVQEAIKHILAEREQKDKRIQELEEELNYRTNKFIEITNLYLNSISKQVVIDAINKHKLAYEELSKMYNNTHYEDDEKRARDFYMIVTEDRIMQILQELLEGRNENG